MSIANADIRRKHVDPNIQEMLVKVNNASATVTDINATSATLPMKEGLRRVLAGGQTRQDINALAISLPAKETLLAIAGL